MLRIALPPELRAELDLDLAFDGAGLQVLDPSHIGPALWERWLREHPEATLLPPLVPVIIHSGRRPWRSPTTFHALVDLPSGPGGAWLRRFVPDYGCVLFDLADPASTASRLLTADDTWLERLEPLRDEAGGASTLAAFLCYLLYVSPVEGDRARRRPRSR